MATRSETRESLLEGMVTIFNFIGYVPNTIWFDQMSSVALRTRDERGVVKPTDFIDIIKLRPNAFKYSGIYTLLPTSWQDYLKSLDKESYRQAFDVLRMILLEEDMDYADKVLKETLKHKSISPEAVEITYKRFKEDHTLFESTIYFPEDLPPYEVDINQYDLLLLGGERR